VDSERIATHLAPVVNSNKITPMNNKDVWSKGSDNQWIKCLQATTTKADSKSNVEQHHKHKQSNKDKQ